MIVASTASVPSGATRGTSSSVAGRLLTRLASTVASTASSSSDARPELAGSRSSTRAPRNVPSSAATTTPRQSTNTPNEACVERSAPAGVRWPTRTARTTRTRAAAPATQNGSRSYADATTKPASISSTTITGKRGSGSAQVAGEVDPHPDVLHGDHHHPHRRHHQEPAQERQVDVGQRQQVGQV